MSGEKHPQLAVATRRVTVPARHGQGRAKRSQDDFPAGSSGGRNRPGHKVTGADHHFSQFQFPGFAVQFFLRIADAAAEVTLRAGSRRASSVNNSRRVSQ